MERRKREEEKEEKEEKEEEEEEEGEEKLGYTDFAAGRQVWIFSLSPCRPLEN